MAQKKDVAAIVSGAGWIGSLAGGIVTALRERGASDKEIHSLVVDGGDLSVGRIADVLLEDIRTKNNTQPAPVVPGKFFMTVTLGIYPNIAELRQSVLFNGKKIIGYANQILDNIKLGSETINVDLWEVSGAQLGFTEAVSRGAIYKRFRDFGFEECSAEEVVLSYIKCTDGKLRIGAMEESIRDLKGYLHILSFSGSSGDLCLDTCDGGYETFYDPNLVWVLVRTRRVLSMDFCFLNLSKIY